jgi:hypothetical protein
VVCDLAIHDSFHRGDSGLRTIVGSSVCILKETKFLSRREMVVRASEPGEGCKKLLFTPHPPLRVTLSLRERDLLPSIS